MTVAAWRFAGVMLVGLAPAAAFAADLPPAAPPPAPTAPAAYQPAPAPPDWTVTVGAEGRMIPAWPGAPLSEAGFTGLPLFGIRKAGTPEPYFGPRDSFGFPVLDLDMFKLGPAVRLVWQRKASDYAALNGLGDVNYAVQAGGFAEFWAVPWLRLRTEVRQGFGGEKGVTGDAFLDLVVPWQQFRFSAGPRVTLQTASAVSPYFSITAAQAAASGASYFPALTPYSATGGLYSYGAGGEVEYFWNPQWSTHAFVEYERLTGSVADSPLVTERGSPNQITVGLGATYSFNIKPFW